MIPKDELKVFESLKDIKVVVDVGARDDVDYLILKPGIELHAFEPNVEWFRELQINVGNTPNVYINNFALGDEEGTFKYSVGGESVGIKVEDPENPLAHEVPTEGERLVEVKRLDSYIKEHNITQIDFLKMDVEGYEEKVIKGMGETINICRYIQYEQGASNTKTGFQRFLPEDLFDMYYIGYRNVLAVRKGEELPYIPEDPQEGGVGEKDQSNYLNHGI